MSVRPLAWCPGCNQQVRAIQVWKQPRPRPRQVGKYARQYVYRCPHRGCRHSLAEPYIRPAAAVIDWSDTGKLIGDRSRPLAANTTRRIQAALETLAHPATGSPGDRMIPAGLILPVGGANHSSAPTTLSEPMRTRLTRDTDALVIPPAAGPVKQPADVLVLPYRRAAKPRATSEPLTTVSTKEHAALLWPAPEVSRCRLRMLTPREALRAQRFPDSYVVTGNHAEQVMQAGNAVSSNVAHWLGTAIAAVL